MTSYLDLPGLTGHVEIPVSLLSPPTAPTTSSSGQPSASTSATPPVSTLTKEKKKKHRFLASSDPLYRDLRDTNFSTVGKRLNKTARRLDEDYKVPLLYSLVYYMNIQFEDSSIGWVKQREVCRAAQRFRGQAGRPTKRAPMPSIA